MMLEEYEYREPSRKRVYVLLVLLVLLGGLAVVVAFHKTTGLKGIFATLDKLRRANQASAEPNQPAVEPNKAPVEPNKSAAKVNKPNKPQPAEPSRANVKEPLHPTHRHPAFTERVQERARMVDWQIEARGITDPNVLTAMRVVPRHAFVPSTEQRYAYADYALPIGHDQTISQPYIVAFMTQTLKLNAKSKVLEIGTGSGYQAAVCAEICKEVYTVEIVEELAEAAKKRLKELGYANVFVRTGDGYFGWPQHAPFDAIIGTAAVDHIPDPLIKQLRPGGRMILPYGSAAGSQNLVLITKDNEGRIHKNTVMPVRFVPMSGEVQKSKK
jgi:protein-L-isoaspartate(D-aspartate) O-methyltransferase